MIAKPMDHKQLHVDVHHEDGSYGAEVRELPGCFASGHDVPELIESVQEAIALYRTVVMRRGRIVLELPAELARERIGEIEQEYLASGATHEVSSTDSTQHI